MNDKADRPFSESYVISTTLKNMRKSVDISIGKTVERIPEFADDLEKSREVFGTLAKLHTMRKNIDNFQS
jgi:hypothetical protein